MAFSNVHYVSIYQTVTSLTYVFVLLAFRPPQRAAIISGSISLVIFLAITWFVTRVGRKESEDEYISGMTLTDKPAEVNRLLKRNDELSDLRVGDLHMVRMAEVLNFLMHGTIGVGKSTLIRWLLDHIRKRGDRAIIYDSGCTFTETHYKPDTDFILNAHDARCANWHMWGECVDAVDYDNLAASLIPVEGESDPFWVSSSRTIFADLAIRMSVDPDRSIEKFLKTLLSLSMKSLRGYLANTPSANLVEEKIEKTAISIRSVVTNYAKALRYLQGLDDGSKLPFTIREWMTQERYDNSWLFISTQARHRKSVRPLISLWVSLATLMLQSMGENSDRRVWFIIDEATSLQRIPELAETLAEARKFGGCFVLGMQNMAQLVHIYGRELAKSIFDLMNTRMYGRSPSAEMAKVVEEELGNQRKRKIREQNSYGLDQVRDGVSLGKDEVNNPIVDYEQVMRLPNLNFYVRLPGEYPVVRLKLKYRKQKKRNVGLMERNIRDALSPELERSIQENERAAMSAGISFPNHVHRAGHDLTFSAPKSVSVLALIGNDKGMLEAHNQAVEIAAGYVEKLISARDTRDGITSIVPTGKMVAAAFTHDTSRNLDPQLHTHLIVANMTESDGKWKALATDYIHNAGFIETVMKMQVTLGKIYRNALRERVEALGHEIEEVGPHGMWEIKGVPEEVREEFSSRGKEIEGAVGAEATLRSRDVAAKDTRQAKVDPSRLRLMERWNQQMRDKGFDLHDYMRTAAERAVPPGMEREQPGQHDRAEISNAVMMAVSHLSDSKTRFTWGELLLATTEFSDRLPDAGELKASINTALKEGIIIPLDSEKGVFTSRIHLLDELSIQALSKEHLQSGRVVSFERTAPPAPDTLRNIETDALVLINAPSGVAGIRDLTRTLAESGTARGRDVRVLASSAERAASLAKAEELKDKLIGRPQHLSGEFSLKPQSTLIVEGAERLGLKETLVLLGEAREKNAQLIFLDSAGRQANGNAMSVLESAGVSRTRYNMQVTGLETTVQSIADKRDRYDALATRYAELSGGADAVTAVVIGQREQKHLTSLIRDALQNAGQLERDSVTVETRTLVWLDSKTRKMTGSYRPGQVLEDRSDARETRNFVIDRVHEETRVLSLIDQDGVLVRQKLSDITPDWRLFNREDINVATGEKLVAVAASKSAGVKAKDRLTVSGATTTRTWSVSTGTATSFR